MEPERYFHSNGRKSQEEWRDNGKQHRLDGPSLQWWHINGQKQKEEWRIDGELHRVNGPARILWDENGGKQKEEWWINGIKVDVAWFEEHNLQDIPYENWTEDLKLLFKLTWE